ncbi:MAG: magnesium transporter [Clostridia bacterium]|nr:magnesium transporter [Clostridia bacterium]
MEEKILEMIEQKKFSALKSMLSEMQPPDIAAIFEEAPEKDIPIIFRILPKELAAEVFVEMDSDKQQLLIEAFSDKELHDVIDELFMDDTVDIIDEMPATVTKRILKQTDSKTRRMINQLLAYPDDSAGSIMTTEYIDLKKSMTVDDAFERIRQIGFDSETIYSCYVTDAGRHLLGIVSVKDLLLNPKTEIIANIMDENVIFANTLDDQEYVAGLFEKYDMLALPIVDKEERLVGIVTVDDAIDVLQEEATEDIEKMAAILPSEHSYFKTSVFETFKARIPWLMLLMISATFTGAIISGFEDKLIKFGALIAFIPMLMDTGGNSGSQASVTVIRAISMGDIEFKDILKVLWKEIRVALFCALALVSINFIKLFFIDNILLHNFDTGREILEICVVSATLFFAIIVAKIIGCSLPILAKKVGFDPAVMASPLITTIVDAISLLIYFLMATAILGTI